VCFVNTISLQDGAILMLMANSKHKPESQLIEELELAAASIPVGAAYAHYKHPELQYIIIGHCILEANDETAVLYQAQYGSKLTFARAVSIFMEHVEWNGESVPRFASVINS
jgi:hypothetical protein